MKIYTIIGGVNGVGKSSLLGVLSAINTEIGIIIDMENESSEITVNDCLKKGINFTQETTLSGVRTLKTINEAREKGYFIRLYYIGVSSAGESVKRIKNRVEKGGHDIPLADVERQYNKRFEDLIKILPYCNEVRFYDNENGFKEKVEYKNGSLILKGGNTPLWLKELSNYLKEQQK